MAASNGIATTTHKLFRRTTAVAITVQAAPAVVWELLTNVDNMTIWNSTLVSIEGVIQEGATIRLVSTLAPERTFKLKIKALVPFQKLVWGDAMGTRTYSLQEVGDHTTVEMTETIGGPLFPLFAKHIPSFDAAFEQWAADLKKAAEDGR